MKIKKAQHKDEETAAEKAIREHGLSPTGKGRALFYDMRLGQASFSPKVNGEYPYRGIDAPEAKTKQERTIRGHSVKLMPCKPFKKAARSRRIRRHTWVRI